MAFRVFEGGGGNSQQLFPPARRTGIEPVRYLSRIGRTPIREVACLRLATLENDHGSAAFHALYAITGDVAVVEKFPRKMYHAVLIGPGGKRGAAERDIAGYEQGADALNEIVEDGKVVVPRATRRGACELAVSTQVIRQDPRNFRKGMRR